MQTPKHLQARVPREWHRRIHDLSYETDRSISELMSEAVLLLLQFHRRDEGLPKATLRRKAAP